MSFPFSAIVTASGAITFTDREGTSHTISRENPRYDEAKELLRQVSEAGEDDQDTLIGDLVNIASPVKAIASDTGGRVFVEAGEVFFRDLDNTTAKVHNVVAERIVWMLSEGFDAKPMLAFLDFLMDNPSYRSVNDLYRFMERNQMGITPDGHLLAYKKVRSNFHDIHSGQFDNSPGQRPKMRRNEVEDNPDVTCSKGLHVCSFGYLPHFGSSGGSDRVVVCKVNPRDVVSVPVDYSDAKMRVCEYLVLKEIKYQSTGDVLSTRPVIDEKIDHDEDDNEGNDCPNCGTDIGNANYCAACGWEDRADDPVNDDASEVEDHGTLPAPTVTDLPPVIEFRQGDNWQPMFGHGCNTRVEALNYIAALDPSGDRLRLREEEASEATPATNWPDKGEDRPTDLRDAVTGVTDTANVLFGDKGVAVHMRLDGEGGLEVKMRPESELFATTKRILIEHLGVEDHQVTPKATIMGDLGADSLDVVELVMAFEEEFSIEIRDEEFDVPAKDMPVSDIVKWLDQNIDHPVK